MKKTDTKRKLRAVLITAIVGAGLFVMLTIGTIAHYFSLGATILIASPVSCVSQLLGTDKESAARLMNSDAFAMIVNGVFGAAVFSVIAAFWQFLLKKNHEK